MSQMDGSTRAQLISRAVGLEWPLFQSVNNIGGTASCQTMPDHFRKMRSSQFHIWTDEIIKSYIEDLERAIDEQRNPLAEKYGYMMQRTHPDEFEKIRKELPLVTERSMELIENIVERELQWADEMSEKYPRYMHRGRPVHAESELPGVTSLETYSRGELATYSEQTLELLWDHFSSSTQNLHEVSAAEQARLSGYETLADAERALGQM